MIKVGLVSPACQSAETGIFLYLVRGTRTEQWLERKKGSPSARGLPFYIFQVSLFQRKNDLQLMELHIGRLLYLNGIRQHIRNVTPFIGHYGFEVHVIRGR
jgi:hypothetical protein